MAKVSNTLSVFLREVVQANTIAGNDITDKTLIPMYDNLVREEINETINAFGDNNTVEILDGLIDVMVVSGYNIILQDREPMYHICFDTTEDFIKALVQLKDSGVDYLRGIYYESLLFLLENDGKLWYALPAMLEVTRSNLSKFVPYAMTTEECGLEVQRIESQGRYGGVKASIVDVCGKVYTVFKADRDVVNGIEYSKPKYMKAFTFSEPNLKQFLIHKDNPVFN